MVDELGFESLSWDVYGIVRVVVLLLILGLFSWFNRMGNALR